VPSPSVSPSCNKATLDAIKAKTDNLPTDPADESVLEEVKAKTDDLIPNITPQSGTYTHPAGTTEQDAIVLSISTRTKINNIYLDLTNLTQNCTIRIYAKIDGATYVLLDSLAWTTSDEDGVVIDSIVSDVDVKVSIQSAISEGTSRSIPYRVV
jgi:hypothetical protein